MTHLWMLVVLVLSAVTEVPATPPAPKGRLCIGEKKSSLTSGKCVDTAGVQIVVTPAETERLFLWTSQDQSTAQLGVLSPKAAQVDLDPAVLSTLSLTIASDSKQAWPADVDVNFLSGKEQWIWAIDAKAVSKLRNLMVPKGPALIRLAAPHHRTLVRNKIAATGKMVALGELRLAPLPVARGVVVDGEGKPVTGVMVSLPDATVCTTGNEQGAFSCELLEPIPEALVISSAGYGERELLIARETTPADVNLGRIVLTNGRKLTLKIIRPSDTPAKVSLFFDNPEKYEHSKLRTLPLTEREETVRFEVGAGTYQILIEGDEALERLEEQVELRDVDLEKEIRVEPYTLVGTYRLGEDPVNDSKVLMISPSNTWRAALAVSDGKFGGTLWQKGKFRAFVGKPEEGMGELVESPELGDDPSHWDIQIKKRLITGHVLDSETRRPVVNSEFRLTVRSADGEGHFPVKVDADGAYSILASRPGTYGLRVSAPGYIDFDQEVPIKTEDKGKTVEIALETGVLQPLDIVDAAGAPIANPIVLEGIQADRVNVRFMSTADARGRYQLRGRPGETRVLYMVPTSGSFAVVRVQVARSEADVKPLRVVVPPATSSLQVKMVNAEGAPVNAGLLIRANGEFIPSAILRFVTGEVPRGGTGERTIPRLPSGTYEIWGLAGPRDEEAVIQSQGSLRPPARVGLSGGEQVVTVPAPPRAPRG